MTARNASEPFWAELDERALLALPLARLALPPAGGLIARPLERLTALLARRGVRLSPDLWVSTDFFSPDGAAGFAVPFWLTHPRLARLERKLLGEVEGRAPAALLRLLAHETAHAVQHAFELHRRPAWRALFGRPSTPYRRTYRADPADRRFVRNLPRWYAQSHPHEDYAETFAVWLLGEGRRFEDWPAAAKLRGLEALLARHVLGRRAPRRARVRADELARLPGTLGELYARRRAALAREPRPPWAAATEELFPRPASPGRGRSAARHLALERAGLLARAGRTTDHDRDSIGDVLDGMIVHARRLDLRLGRRPPSSRAVLLAVDDALRRLASGKARLAR